MDWYGLAINSASKIIYVPPDGHKYLIEAFHVLELIETIRHQIQFQSIDQFRLHLYAK